IRIRPNLLQRLTPRYDLGNRLGIHQKCPDFLHWGLECIRSLHLHSPDPPVEVTHMYCSGPLAIFCSPCMAYSVRTETAGLQLGRVEWTTPLPPGSHSASYWTRRVRSDHFVGLPDITLRTISAS